MPSDLEKPIPFDSDVGDYRLKINVVPLPPMWDRIKMLHPISYGLKDQGPTFKTSTREFWGFNADDLQTALSSTAATGTKDDTVSYQTSNPWVVIAALTKALQEAQARIEALEINAQS